MTRVRRRLDDGIPGGTPLGPAWEESGSSVGGHPATPITQVIQGLLPSIGWIGGMSSRGPWRAGVDTNLPLDSLRALPRAGHDSFWRNLTPPTPTALPVTCP